MLGFTDSEYMEHLSLLSDFMQGHNVFPKASSFTAYFIDGDGEYSFLGKVSAFNLEEAKAKFADIIGSGTEIENKEVKVVHWSEIFWKSSIETVANMAQAVFFSN